MRHSINRPGEKGNPELEISARFSVAQAFLPAVSQVFNLRTFKISASLEKSDAPPTGMSAIQQAGMPALRIVPLAAKTHRRHLTYKH
jgi:hypothetical protein